MSVHEHEKMLVELLDAATQAQWNRVRRELSTLKSMASDELVFASIKNIPFYIDHVIPKRLIETAVSRAGIDRVEKAVMKGLREN